MHIKVPVCNQHPSAPAHTDSPHNCALLVAGAFAVLRPAYNPATEDAALSVGSLRDGLLLPWSGRSSSEVRRKQHKLRQLPLCKRALSGDDEQGIVDLRSISGAAGRLLLVKEEHTPG
jgi:hypothetical protein